MTQRILTDEQIQAAADVLAAPSEPIGAARAMVIRTKFKAEKVWARLYRESSETTVERRKAWATDHPDYETAINAYADAEGQWETLKDQRNKAELVIEAWRTMSSNDRSSVRSMR